MKTNLYVARSKAIAARVLGDQTMVMSATDSTLFTLDEVASVIWESADGVTPLEKIVTDKICTQYDVAAEVALQEAEAFVNSLAQHGILLVSDQPISQSGDQPNAQSGGQVAAHSAASAGTAR